jgi:TATA-box binding protein (TBP) (component of TFIID and TFIIIB)
LLLFNNGTIRIAGAKEENDGLRSCEVLLEEMKKERSIFFEMEEEEIQNLRVQNYRTTMINSDFKLNFKVDLKTFLNCIQRDMSNVFTKFNPDKYRGLILGFFWNMNKEKQNGICGCETRCKGKGTGNGVGECKKITISIFKSGSTIITGARSMEQIECAYAFLIHLVKIYYGDIMKVSIVDYLEKPNEEIDFDEMERYIAEEEKKVKEEEKKKKKKLVKDA